MCRAAQLWEAVSVVVRFHLSPVNLMPRILWVNENTGLFLLPDVQTVAETVPGYDIATGY